GFDAFVRQNQRYEMPCFSGGYFAYALPAGKGANAEAKLLHRRPIMKPTKPRAARFLPGRRTRGVQPA
ncbi:MAG: hypothetical protein ACYCWA_13085, partial [Thiobacillus sp.]